MSGKADYRDASRIEHMYAALCRVKELFAGITRAEFVEGMSRIWQVLVDDVPVWYESIKPVCEALPQPVGMPPNLSDFD